MKKKEEAGRTILEMLGVLVLMGILLVGSMAGYNFLVQRQKRQQAVKDVVTLVTALKVTQAAKKYAYPSVIPVREIAKGVTTEDNGEVLKLGDAEDSYAVVRALKNGGFTITLQTEESTCEEIMAALSLDPTARRFDDKGRVKSTEKVTYGALKNQSKELTEAGKVIWKEEDGRKIEVKEVTAGKELTLLDRTGCIGFTNPIVLCPQEAKYLCDGNCQACPCHQQEDANGTCCDITKPLCEGMCECPRGYIAMGLGTDKCACVECDGTKDQATANTDCVNRAQALGLKDSSWWGAHACNKEMNKCVECVENKDCWETKDNPFYSKYGQDQNKYKHIVCNTATNRCEECQTSYQGTKVEGYCPEEWPVCQEGRCLSCKPYRYDPEKGRCETDCKKALGSDYKRNVCGNYQVLNSYVEVEYDADTLQVTTDAHEYCAVCIDNRSGVNTDENCCSARPICVGEDSGIDWAKGVTGLSGEGCYKCVDNEEGNAVDKGCGTATPICVEKAESGFERLSGGSMRGGDACVECTEDADCGEGAECDLETYTCKGCPAEAPFACEKDGENACCKCYDNRSKDAEDGGCAKGNTRRLCQPNNNLTGNGTGLYGDTCYQCQDSATEAGVDYGCDRDDFVGKTICVENVTRGIVFDEDGASGEYGDGCVKCYDSAEGAGKDVGCGEGEEKDKKICRTENKKSDGSKETGYKCIKCYDDKSSVEADTGCGEDREESEPICLTDGTAKNNGSKDEGNKCVQCLVNADCYAQYEGDKPICDKNVCVSCSDYTKGEKPYWNNEAKECVYCNDDQDAVGQDTGCPGAKEGETTGQKLCVPEDNKPTTMSKTNGTKWYGEKCRLCQDNKAGAAADYGCDEESPICVADGVTFNKDAATNKYGPACAKCYDDAAGVSKDTGCVENSPICVKSDDEKDGWVNTGSKTPGSQCVFCYDGKAANGIDDGCDTEKPLCVGSDTEKADWKNGGTKTVGSQCVYCYDNNQYDEKLDSSPTDAGCTDAKPLCVVAAQNNWADAGDNTVGSQCIMCFDDKVGNEKDTGCQKARPICVDGAVSYAKWINNGGRNKGSKCVQCITREDCPSGQVCNGGECVVCLDTESGNKDDDGCGANSKDETKKDKPLCVYGSDSSKWVNNSTKTIGSQCVFCYDSSEGDGQDEGCPGQKDDDTKKLCMPFDKTAENGSYREGGECHVCVNNKYGQDSGQKDDGCPIVTGLCEAKEGEYGDVCHKCQDDADNADQDSGCGTGDDENKPICVVDTKFSQKATEKYGTSCVKCYDDAKNNNQDTGCSTEKPFCADSLGSQEYQTGGTGKIGTACFECIDNYDCPSEKPVCNSNHECELCDGFWVEEKKHCYRCIDDKGGSEKDGGCPLKNGKENEKMCKPADNPTGNGTGLYGENCYVCRNDKTDATADEGCDKAGSPMCDADADSYGTDCHMCQDTVVQDSDASEPDLGCPVDEKFCGRGNKGDGEFADDCYKCKDTVNQHEKSGVDLGCPATQKVCVTDDKEEVDGKLQHKDNGNGSYGRSCVECLTSVHCPNDQFCDTSTNTCQPCNEEGSAIRCEGDNVEFCDSEICHCPSGYKEYFGSTISTNKGANGGLWVCRFGCQEDADCDDNGCCFFGGDKTRHCDTEKNNCHGTNKDNSFKGRCVALEKKEHKGYTACPIVCDEKCGRWNPTQKECENTCNPVEHSCGECEVWVDGKCVSTCKSNQICVRDVGNSKQSCETCSNKFVCKDLDCDEWRILQGRKYGNKFRIPPAGDYRFTRKAAAQACEQCGWKLANMAQACGKDRYYNSGWDCINIASNVKFGNEFLSKWGRLKQGADGKLSTADGTFWLEDENEKTKDYYMLVSYLCGNNHSDHCCFGFYPICYFDGTPEDWENCPESMPIRHEYIKDDPSTSEREDCFVCRDSQTGTNRDIGCVSNDKPVCLTVNRQNNGQGDYGRTCVSSLSKPCNANQFWDGKKCRNCKDDAIDNNKDTGCSDDKPICGAVDGQSRTRNDGNGTFGDTCYSCMNNEKGAARDIGCDDENPQCKAKDGYFGDQCMTCSDTTTGGNTDTGCGSGKWAGKPICGAEGFRNDGQGTTGDHCAICHNDKTGDARDSGCSNDTPLCNGPQGWFSNTCVVCFDTATGGNTDTGCNKGTWAGKPICGAQGFANDGQGAVGDHCAVCKNDKTGDARDSGCPGDKPICNAPDKWFGNECQCPSGHCMDVNNNCVSLGDYIDLERGADGRCVCKRLNIQFDIPLVQVPIDPRESFNNNYVSKRTSGFRLVRSTAAGSLGRLYCGHQAHFSIGADDCIYRTFLGDTGACDACWNNCINNGDCGRDKNNERFMCPYTSIQTIPPGYYDSIWVEAADIHYAYCAVGGGTVKILE